LVCAVLTAGAYALIVKPIQAELVEQAAGRQQLALEEEQSEQLLATRRRLVLDVARLRRERQESAVRLQTVDYLNTRVSELSALVESSGMMINATELDAIRSHEWYQLVPIRLSGVGEFPDCARFLRELHERMPDTSVQGFNLSGNPSQPAAPSMFSFDLVWYAAPTLTATGE
jgi:Tfp pilus assembly protein PilO